MAYDFEPSADADQLSDLALEILYQDTMTQEEFAYACNYFYDAGYRNHDLVQLTENVRSRALITKLG
jgi:hypothetical protein